jgi:hypothetical protein
VVYLDLFQDRNYPDEQINDWGLAGPNTTPA